MYKLIVVDDKADILDGIIKLGHWAQMNFDVAGKACNGKDAFDLVREHQPDVVITDIRMPIMDGLELTSLIKQHYPLTKVIILSGYDDFSYAQQAVKLGAEEYLLKPARIGMIEEAVLRAYEKLEIEKKLREDSILLQQKLIKSLPLLKDDYFRYLVSTPVEHDLSEFEDRFRFLEIGLDVKNFAVLLIELDHYRELFERNNIKEVELYKFAVANMAQELMDACYNCETFRVDDNRIVLLINYRNDLSLNENKTRISDVAERIRESVEKHLDITVTLGIGGLYEDIKDIYYSFMEAKEAITYRIVLGHNRVICAQDIRINHHQSFHYPIQLENEILSYIKIGVYKQIPDCLDKFIESLINQKDISPFYIKKILRNFVGLISRMTLELPENTEMSHIRNHDFIAEFEKYKTVDEIRSWLNKILCEIAQTVGNMKKSQLEKDIDKAKLYIHQHFNEDISLQTVSEHVCLSPTYFSAVFKELVGETFIEYLIKARVEKAKELLATGQYKIYEIANRVGYEDRRYFSEVFKKHTGLNPAEYMEKLS